MTACQRDRLNNYWCQHHWAPYILAPLAVQQEINRRVPAHVWTRKDFRDAVRQKQRLFGKIRNAPELVVHDWVTEKKMPVCCILGDDMMNLILRNIRREMGLRS